MTQTWSSGAGATFTGSWNGSTFYSPHVDPDRPARYGSGPEECSSSTALDRLPLAIFDVNGYYRELGVPVNATRKQLREAYQAKDGQNSARLTYILGQLLNPAIRFVYDCMPLGQLFVDQYVIERLNQIAKDRMSKRMADLARMDVDLDGVDTESIERDIYAEMGVESEPAHQPSDHFSDTPDEVVDETTGTGQDEPSPAKFEYSYYLWRTPLRDPALGLVNLSQWQRFLVSAFAREGITIKFAVGFHGRMPQRWLQAAVGFRSVFFLNIDETPTEELARDVALRVRLDRGLHQWQGRPA